MKLHATLVSHGGRQGTWIAGPFSRICMPKQKNALFKSKDRDTLKEKKRTQGKKEKKKDAAIDKSLAHSTGNIVLFYPCLNKPT